MFAERMDIKVQETDKIPSASIVNVIFTSTCPRGRGGMPVNVKLPSNLFLSKRSSSSMDTGNAAVLRISRIQRGFQTQMKRLLARKEVKDELQQIYSKTECGMCLSNKAVQNHCQPSYTRFRNKETLTPVLALIQFNGNGCLVISKCLPGNAPGNLGLATRTKTPHLRPKQLLYK